MANRNGAWLTRTVQRKTAKETWDRSNLEMIVAGDARTKTVPMMNGERLKGEVVLMDKDYKKKLEWRNMFRCRRECTDT